MVIYGMKLIILFIIAIFIVFIRIIFRNRYDYGQKGSDFENTVYNIVTEFIEPENVYKNMYIKRKNGRLTEMDIIAVHQTGIYVFECKNYSGWIFGNGKNRAWLQTFKNGDKYKFYNPIFQNEIHINAVKKLLNNYKIPYFSIIVFGNQCELKNIVYNQENTYIIYQDNLKYIMSALLSCDKIRNIADIDKINEILRYIHQSNKDKEAEHFFDLADGMDKCPYCSGLLIERVNKKTNTRFYGCSNYPECKYTSRYKRELI